jgi:tol-pal system protein YbgF
MKTNARAAEFSAARHLFKGIGVTVRILESVYPVVAQQGQGDCTMTMGNKNSVSGKTCSWMMHIKKSIPLFIVPILFISGCALKKDVVYLNERLDTLDKKVNLQKTSTNDTIKEIREDYAKLSNDYEALSERVRQLQGYNDENNHNIQKSYSSSDKLKADIAKLESQIGDLTKRMKAVESMTGTEDEAETGPAKAGGDKTAAIVNPDKATENAGPPDIKLYNDSKAMFDNGDPKSSREGFLKLLKDYPKSKMADNAQFWIGETYFKEKWYQKAILEYQKVIENYPKGSKVAAAYLKQGIAFTELGEKGNARLIFNQLIKKFPGSGEAAIAKKKLEKVK